MLSVYSVRFFCCVHGVLLVDFGDCIVRWVRFFLYVIILSLGTGL